MKNPRIIAIIPARYASTRFPGKPLADIKEKTLIQRTYENTSRCTLLDMVVVATDDERIAAHVSSFGGRAIMTSPDCPSGTDRIAEALRQCPELNNAEIILNVQGDEPDLAPSTIEKVIQALIDDPQAPISTAIIPIRNEEDVRNPSIVKCVIDLKADALYFSRAMIPYGKRGEFKSDVVYYKHIGIYCFRREFLLSYAMMPRTPLQLAEDLEQLKILEHGKRLKTVIVQQDTFGIDTPEDLKKKLKELECEQNISLSQVESVLR